MGSSAHSIVCEHVEPLRVGFRDSEDDDGVL
jgi:hypothetical protein